ncbi:hypothetical protein IWX90DRAFT_487181 [Phyllosticta citrichinensis]|uniref:Kelch repeat protein n=1 Tax=Phyllosticta citrichinensis TaxID=1130410 RepID=A0ABR1XQD1_9PEZI
MGRLSLLLFSLSAIAGRACAQMDGATASSETFLRRGYHSSTVGGGFVWIDGGNFAYTKDSSVDLEFSDTLLALDLSEDWTNDTVRFISNSKTLPSGSTPSTAPSLLYGNGLWYDDDSDTLYTGFSGYLSSFNTTENDGWPMELTAFKTNEDGGGTWSTALNTSSNAFDGMIRPLHPAVAAGNGKGYALGGTTPINGSEQMAEGMLSYDFSTGLFRNNSLQIHRGYTELADMVWVPQFGTEGCFVLLGGAWGPAGESKQFYSWEEIYIMDAATEVFYAQNTTGDYPSGRQEFCTAVVASSNGTVEIFVYGGWGGTLGSAATPYDEIYILTLPAFEWIKHDYTPEAARVAHSCEAVGGSQILLIDGLAGSADDATYTGQFGVRDTNDQGLGIFNMTSLAWEDKYTANPPAYRQADVVAEAYASGGANDSISWNNDNIKSIFSHKNFTITSSGGSSSSSSSASATSTAASKSSSLSGGAIAGIVVGCVAGVAIVAGLLAFCCLRRRRRQASAAAAAAGDAAAAQQQQHQNAGIQEAPYGSEVMEMQAENDRLELDGSAKPPYLYSPLAELPGGETRPPATQQEVKR